MNINPRLCRHGSVRRDLPAVADGRCDQRGGPATVRGVPPTVAIATGAIIAGIVSLRPLAMPSVNDPV
jgi:hypothetical protein